MTVFSEVNAGFFYKSAEEREKLVAAERDFTDERVKKIIALKKSVCEGTDKGFVVVNQKVTNCVETKRANKVEKHSNNREPRCDTYA